MGSSNDGTPGRDPDSRPKRRISRSSFVFLALLATPGLMWPFFAGDLSKTDGFPPAQITTARGWLMERETEFSNGLSVRTPLTRLHSLLAYAIGASPNPRVVLGKSHFLFFDQPHDQMNMFQGADPLNESELASWESGMRARADWLERRGIPCVFVVVPAKWTAYPQHVPDRYSRLGPTRADQILERLQASQTIRLLDLRTEFVQPNGEARDLYFKYDHHWNGYGAFVGYSSIMRTVREFVPAARQLEQEEVLMVDLDNQPGSQAVGISLEWMLQEPGTRVRPADETGVHAKDTGPAQGIRESTGETTLPGDSRALIYGDSFCITEASRLFRASFTASSLRHHNFGKEDFAEVIRFKPKVVVIAMVEFFLPRKLPAPEFPSEDFVATQLVSELPESSGRAGR